MIIAESNKLEFEKMNTLNFTQCIHVGVYIYSGGQELQDHFNIAALSYFSILAIFSILWRIQNTRVKINHKNTFKMFKNITIVLSNLCDFQSL